MNKPELKDFHLREIKVKPKGGAFVDYSYLFRAGNDAHQDSLKFDRSLKISKDMVDLFKSMKPYVLKWADYNYRLIPIRAQEMGIDNIPQLQQIVEGLQMDNLTKVEVTGVKLGTTQKDTRTVVITYKKATQDKKIIGGATTSINVADETFGFEQELDDTIKELISEVYKYVFDNKHSDSDQMELFPDLQEKVEEPPVSETEETKPKKGNSQKK